MNVNERSDVIGWSQREQFIGQGNGLFSMMLLAPSLAASIVFGCMGNCCLHEHEQWHED